MVVKGQVTSREIGVELVGPSSVMESTYLTPPLQQVVLRAGLHRPIPLLPVSGSITSWLCASETRLASFIR